MSQTWLNNLALSKKITNIGKDFKDGFLFGEILFKYGMKHDFDLFKRNQNEECIQNNFRLLEPAFRTLGISFNSQILQRAMRGDEAIIQGILEKMRLSLEKVDSLIRKSPLSPKISVTVVTDASLCERSGSPSPKSPENSLFKQLSAKSFQPDVSAIELQNAEKLDTILLNSPKKPKAALPKGNPLKVCFQNHRRIISKTEILPKVREKNIEDENIPREKLKHEYARKLQSYVSEKMGFINTRKSIPSLFVSRAGSPLNFEIQSSSIKKTPAILCSPIHLPELLKRGKLKSSLIQKICNI